MGQHDPFRHREVIAARHQKLFDLLRQQNLTPNSLPRHQPRIDAPDTDGIEDFLRSAINSLRTT